MLLYIDSTYASPFALSAFVALWEKRIEFRRRPVDLARGEHFQGPYAELSQTMKVPMLQDGSFSLTESSAIAEYIDEAYEGPPLYPMQQQMRARARQIQAWLRSDFLAVRRERPSESIFRHTTLPPLTPEAVELTQRLFAAAQHWIGESGHVCGDWCIADVDLAVMLARLIRNGDAVPVDLVRYTERQWERASMQAWLDLPR